MELKRSTWVLSHLFLIIILVQFQSCGKPFSPVSFDSYHGGSGSLGACAVETSSGPVSVKNGESYLFFDREVSDNCSAYSKMRSCEAGKFTGDFLFSFPECGENPPPPPPKPKTGIRPHVANTSYWEYRGKPTLLVGGFDHGEPFLMRKADLVSELDRLKAAGGNYLRNTMAYFPKTPVESYPFVRRSDGRFNLDQLNPAYWNYLKVLFQESYNRGIIVQVELWDPWMLRGTPWAGSVWSPKNNVNYSTATGVPDTITDLPYNRVNPFYRSVIDGNKSVVLKYQKAFVDEILKTAKPFDNIIFQIDNESFEPLSWTDYWAKYLHDNAGKSVFVADLRSDYDLLSADNRHVINTPNLHDFLEVSQNDIHATNQEHYQAILNMRAAINASGKKRPMNNVKLYKWVSTGAGGEGGEDVAFNRMWHGVFAGVSAIRFHKPPRAGVGLSGNAPKQIKSMRYFANSVDLTKMVPNNGKLSSRTADEAYAMSQVGNGQMQAVYFTGLGDRRVNINLSAQSGTLKLTWYNTDTNAEQDGGTLTAGATRTLQAPSNSRWLAILK